MWETLREEVREVTGQRNTINSIEVLEKYDGDVLPQHRYADYVGHVLKETSENHLHTAFLIYF
jgi:hypothetical protein